ncbi:MAG: glucose-1-phosphate adenylyltransferase [gamma proteobacterium symbiont of Ctena orbiculata]|nr:MAG: glucose-1-phosphate adenylyltransferase [gamma proteobacterium symbiont of Ctena orbiculata]PVV19603.1 MAG: glucose-1-phosphate adenylyltransferase [gamma proteobacterium symbiont of Ctena orbiculata]PVV20672.1 MAG: glucose-1-phosphate adenylyltransferase [gamma proteobacterium symbiont of Ctena orbiculata]
MLDKTLTVILAGGQGSRLQPLTLERTKAAVPFGGQYRIIDFSLVNCLHSGLRRILVLTQYKSHSLQKHLRDGWSLFNPELGEYITAVPPQMRRGSGWYDGTADAVYQNLYMLKRSGAERVLILPGDHIYRMDYAPMIAFHMQQNASVTVACMQRPFPEVGLSGVLDMDQNSRVNAYGTLQVQHQVDDDDVATAQVSMGIYLFSIDKLIEALEEDHDLAGSSHDLTQDILPRMVGDGDVYAYQFGGEAGRVSQDRYWRDVATIDSYYDANMELLDPVPSLDLYQPEWPIRTHHGQNPPARTVPGVSGSEGIFINSIVANGVLIVGGSVQHSILFPKTLIGDEAVIHNSILFDGVKVGDGAQLENCIIDKGVVIPPGARIGFDQESDAAHFTVSPKGVVVVPKGYRFRS